MKIVIRRPSKVPNIIRLKKRRLFGRREIIVVVAAVILTTAGIKASDNIFTGGETASSDAGRCGEDMTLVRTAAGDFCLDKYEASPGSSCPLSDPANQSETRENLDLRDCQPVSRSGAVPWRHISQDQAAVACAKAGKRLPTNEEWYAAALGTPDKDGGWDRDDCQVNDNWAEQPGPAGYGRNCVSAAGAYDMVGNVWEWVAGTVTDGIFEGKQLPASGYVDSTDGASFPGATNLSEPNANYNEDYFWIKNRLKLADWKERVERRPRRKP
ncbi:MAG: formylglycine-generating enzyme family protein [Planctomycetes bacterium]|nr:formylglycine-generating enzyme family protein [Planctomycetota bacterium]